MPKLKVFVVGVEVVSTKMIGGTSICIEVVKETSERIVATTSETLATFLLGVGRDHFSNYGYETQDADLVALAKRRPGVVWQRNPHPDAGWSRVDRRTNLPRKKLKTKNSAP